MLFPLYDRSLPENFLLMNAIARGPDLRLLVAGYRLPDAPVTEVADLEAGRSLLS